MMLSALTSCTLNSCSGTEMKKSPLDEGEMLPFIEVLLTLVTSLCKRNSTVAARGYAVDGITSDKSSWHPNMRRNRINKAF